jgi:hypothetical protein
MVFRLSVESFSTLPTGNDGQIRQFSINTSTGALTSVNSFQTPSSGTSALLYGLTIHPTNEFLYEADPVNNALFGYDLGDGSFSGDIVYRNSDVSVTRPVLTAITPNGKFLYAPIANSIAEYSINLTPWVVERAKHFEWSVNLDWHCGSARHCNRGRSYWQLCLRDGPIERL